MGTDRPTLELADIVRVSVQDYRASRGLPGHHDRVSSGPLSIAARQRSEASNSNAIPVSMWPFSMPPAVTATVLVAKPWQGHSGLNVNATIYSTLIIGIVSSRCHMSLIQWRSGTPV